jgi:hypothetical protein
MIDVLKDRRGVQFESPLIGLYIEVRFLSFAQWSV